MAALDWIKMGKISGWWPAYVLNLPYRILQNRGSQPCFPPNLKHPFFIENIASPSESSLKDLSVWGFSPAKVASQRLQVYVWDGYGLEKREWVRRLGFQSCLLRSYPPSHYHLASLFLTDALILQITSGKSSGTRSQDASRLAPAAGAVGPSASPSPPEDTARPGACGGLSFCTVRFPVLCILSGVLFLQCRVSWCGCLNAAVCCFLKAF